MTFSQTPFLSEIAAGHSGPPIPAPKLAYFQQRLRNRIFNFLLEKFVAAQNEGLTKASLARRIGRTPDVINRWLGAPTNLTIDTISDILLGIAAEELELDSSSPLVQVTPNYSHFDELIAESKSQDYYTGRRKSATDVLTKTQQRHSEMASKELEYDPDANKLELTLGIQ